MPKTHAAGILVCYILIFCAARAMDASSATASIGSRRGIRLLPSKLHL